MADEASAIEAAELRRCAAIGRQDRAALEALLSEDLIYVHANGLREGKAELVQTLLAGGSKTMTRGAMTVRQFGEVALLLGTYTIDVSPWNGTPARRTEATALQVWVNGDSGWQLEAHQGSRVPEGT